MNIVILAGGSGTRFWPLSRASLPKQLVSITGDRTMLQRTVDRVLPMKPERVLIITNHLQAAETARQVAHYTDVPVEVIAEPVGRNTAPAIGLAAALLAEQDPAAVMAVLPADHFIRDEQALRTILTSAGRAATEGSLVTLGIMPSRPETGYGYIEAEMADGATAPFVVKRFVEKPPLSQALHYLEQGNFFWNSGMFVWSAEVILREIQTHMPALGTALAAFSADTGLREERIGRLYGDIENVSIDYGVMEKSSCVKMMPVEMGWSDVGSWSALPEVVEPGEAGTVCINAAGHIAVDSSDCLIYGDGRMVATVGVHNLVVVSTADALLVCDRERCQDVKKVVEQLSAKGLTGYL